jgi:hypothetical protein
MSVAPVIDQLTAALTERTRLENNFKTKILNRINAILQGLENCDRASLPPAAAGALNIAIEDLNKIVRQIRTPDNMTDAHVEEIVEPLERRRRNNTLRLLPGTTIDGVRPLSNPPPASALTGPRSPFSSLFSRFTAPARATVDTVPTERGSSVYRNGPRSLFGDNLYDDFEGVPPGVTGLAVNPLRPPVTGGKRTRRKYHRKA